MALEIIVCIVIGYLIGTVSTGYIYGKTQKLDIRDYGSGNAGTTNAFRVMGSKGGVITFIGDFLKALIPLLLIKYVIFSDVEYVNLIMLVFGFGIVIGHNYPIWLHFKGGKGIASSGGVFVALDPLILIPGAVCFGGLIGLTKYVSIGSLCLSLLYPVWVAIRFRGDPYYPWLIAVTCLFTLSAFFRHRANIKRLFLGTENKVGVRIDISEKNKK